MSETKEPDIIKASVNWKGMEVRVQRKPKMEEGESYIDSLVLEIDIPDGSIRLESWRASWLKHNLYRLFQSIE